MMLNGWLRGLWSQRISARRASGSGRGARSRNRVWSRAADVASERRVENHDLASASERLEDRSLLTVFTVTTTNDSGAGSLRQAIADANSAAGADTIEFELLASDARHLYYQNDGVAGQVSLSMTAVTAALDDTTIANIDPDYAHSWWSMQPLSALPAIGSSLIIDGYSQDGASVNTLAGADPIADSNSSPRGDNAVLRIELNGALAGGHTDGLVFTGSNSVVRGLAINGYFITSNPFYNKGAAIHLKSGGSNLVQGNFLGTDISGTVARANKDGGIRISDGGGSFTSSNNTIGGTAPGDRNVISGNSKSGITMYGASQNNRIQGNFIGTDRTGTVAMGNLNDGITFSVGSSATGNVVGGTAVGAGNVISANGQHGVYAGGSAFGTVVQGNFIGTDVTGSQDLGNTNAGVDFDMPGTWIGGANADDGALDDNVRARNVISGNGQSGVVLRDNVGGSLVQGNYIGTDVSGTLALGNSEMGVITGSAAQHVTIGGTTAGAGNVISANAQDGIQVVNATVQGNYVGTNAAGTAALGNSTGIRIPGRSSGPLFNVQIGGADVDDGLEDGVVNARNVISGNGRGIDINSNWAGARVVQGNLIGTDVTGIDAIPNGEGMLLSGGFAGTIIGGSAIGASNTIAFNQSAGIRINNSSNNVIQSNAIHDNFGAGMHVEGGDTNAMLSNSIVANGGLGIELGSVPTIGLGVTPNDSGDGDSGQNRLQNFPVIAQAISNATSTTIDGTLNSTANTSFTVEFFSNVAADPTGYGEGQTFLGSTVVTTDGSGNASFSAAVDTPVPAGQFVTATATRRMAVELSNAWWTGNGNANDTFGGYHGALVNGTTFATGILGDAFSFDGVDDQVWVPRIALRTGLTFEGWINTTSADATSSYDGNAALNLLGDDTNSVYLGFGIHGGRVRYNHYASGWQSVTGATAVNDGNWHHIAVTHNQSTGAVSLYVDGIAEATGSIMYATDNAAVTRLGSGYQNLDVFSGRADEVSVFNHPLTAEEIAGIFSSGGAIKPAVSFVSVETSEFSLNQVVESGNQAPVSNDDSYSVAEGSTLSQTDGRGTATSGDATDNGVLANDTDANGDTLSAILVSGPANAASFTLNADGSFSYVHDGSETTSDSFSYKTNDGTVDGNVATVAITVTEVNDAPTADDDSATVAEDSVGNVIVVLGNDSPSENGQTLTVTSVSALHGSVTINGDATLSYSPDSNYNGPDTISYTVRDNGTTNGVADPKSVSATVSVTVTPVNDAPVLAPIGDRSTDEETALSFPVTSLDIDTPLSALSYVVAGLPAGSVFVNTGNGAGQFVWTPAYGQQGTHSITFTVFDNGNPILSDSETITITVREVNDAPLANADSATVAEDSLGNIIAVLANDTPGPASESGQSLTLTPASALHGSVWVNGDGTLSYSPDSNYNGLDTISYTIQDNGTTNGAADPKTASATVSVTVTEVNDAPTAGDDSATVVEDSVANVIVVLTNDSSGPANESGQSLTVTSASALHGSVTINGDGTLSYSPDANYNGADTISYTTQDNGTTNGVADPLTATGTVSVMVTEVNDAPTAGNDTKTVAEDSSSNVIVVLTNDSPGPANETSQTLTVMAASALHGTVTIYGSSALLYSPDADYNGPDTITYTIQDNGTTNGVADPRTAAGTVDVTVTEVNDSPTAGTDSATVAEDSVSNVIVVLANDSTGPANESDQSLTVTFASASHGTVTINGDGTLSYSPDADFNGPDTINYSIRDNGTTNGIASPRGAFGTVSVTVTEINDTPTAGTDSATVSEDSIGNVIVVLTNDSSGPANESSQALTVMSASALHGSVTINGDGSLSYSPLANYNGSDTISYTIQDNGTTNGAADPKSGSATVSVTVTPVNDPPAFTSTPLTTATQDVLYSYIVTTADPDGEIPTISAVTRPIWLTLVDNHDGTATFSGTPNNSQVGTFSVTLRATDAAGATATQSFTVTVANVNDAPQITSFSSDSECGSLATGKTATVSAIFTDPDLGDSFTALIDWGDGTTSLGTVSRSGANGTVSASHTYGQGGVYAVTLTLSDAASATTFATTTVMITGGRIVDGVLQIVGTDLVDRVNVSRNGPNRYKVVARFGSQHSVGGDDDDDEQEDEWDDDGDDDNEHHGRGGQKFSQTFNAASVQSILVILCGGDDRANIGGSVQIAAILEGGDGDDWLNGGSGTNILIGGNGNDRLIGGRGRDFLIGGLGCDRMVGNGGEDILIAGATSFDAQHAALSAIMSEWNSNRDFASRVANIRGTGTGPRLNGSSFLQNGVTVLNDGAADKLTGSAGTDWFFFNTPQDRVTDLKNNEARN